MNPVEPSADTRSFAHSMMEMFVALQAEGFTERQALIIIGQMIAGAAEANRPDEPTP